ncbi:transposase [Bradyrhizobium sp. USDA 4541]|nr:transposase [Bradyrhizobium sp. USDA 4541]
MANATLRDLSGEFGKFYTDFGRPSIAPEKLLRAMLLQAFYGVRSERHPMERMEFDLLLRWFVGLGVDDTVWDHSTFSKNRDRLHEGEIAAKFLNALLAQPKVKRLLSSDHFSVDGTLIEAWAVIRPAILALSQFWCSSDYSARLVWPEADRFSRGHTSDA